MDYAIYRDVSRNITFRLGIDVQTLSEAQAREIRDRMTEVINEPRFPEPEGFGTVVRVEYERADPAIFEQIRGPEFDGRWATTYDEWSYSWDEVISEATSVTVLFSGDD